MKPRRNFLIGVLLLLTHETAYAHDPIKYMLIAGAFLLIPGAIAASIAKQKRIWWFLASIPLMASSVWLAFTMRAVNPYIFLALPLVLIPLSIWQNSRIEMSKVRENEHAS